MLHNKKGMYIAYEEDNKGTYYKGSKYCYSWIPLNTNLHSITANCGIYILNNQSKPYKAYYYVKSIKRISTNLMAGELLQNTYGINAPLMTMFDPEIVFEKKIPVIISNNIQWIQK